MDKQPRRFVLDRTSDPTGLSGTGHVAEGVEWTDGSVTIRWRGERSSLVHWRNICDVFAIHGHGGVTRVFWIDPSTSEGPT